jgi:aldehyde dehydrogenase (NAD+)
MSPGPLIQQQRERIASGAADPAAVRREALRRLLAAVEDNERVILDALHSDLGKGELEAFTSEVQMTAAECRYALKHLDSWMKAESRAVPMLARPGKAKVRRDACGVVLILGPWNYPLQLLLTPLVGALAGGNAAVLKPSEFAPRTSEVVAKIIGSTFDPAEVAVVTGGPEVAEALLEERFDHVFFTGSTATGRKVAAAAARHLTPVTLELGGKCPVLVFGGDEAATERLKGSLDVVARRLAWGKHLNAGQTCVAPDHVLVDQRLHDPLVEALGRAFKSFEGGEYGRIVNRRHFDRVLAFLGDGTIAHGGASDPERLHLEPTVLTGVAADAPVMTEEIFGPVLPVLPFDSLDAALDLVRSRPDPLALYVFSKDDGVVSRIVNSTRSGGVCVNDTVVHITGFELPFGGVGDSGMGRYRGKAGFDTFTRERVVLRRGLWPDLPFRYPSAKQTLAALKKLPRFLRGG